MISTNPRVTGIAPREPSVVKAFGADVPVATDRDGICAAQQLVGAGSLVLDGVGVSGGAYACGFTGGRKITVYSAGDLSARTFTITGTDKDGAAQTEDIVGPDTTPTTNTGTKHFQTVTDVSVDGTVGTDVEVGFAASLVCLFLRDGAAFDLRPTNGETVIIALYGATGVGFGDRAALKLVGPATGTFTFADGTTPSDARVYFAGGTEPTVTVSGTDWFEFVCISDATSGDTLWYAIAVVQDIKV
ncbi:MAG TPA: hypothetical protein VJZ25_07025 [Gemmatimonadaceae bacterium]|nr:hypothetical protein [Gemmatimonadaceae bacterium]